MGNATHDYEPTASAQRMAGNDMYPDTAGGAVPVSGHTYALDAYRAFDDRGLAETPQALAACVGRQQHAAF